MSNEKSETYSPREDLKTPGARVPPMMWMCHGLRNNQKQTRHQEQEDVKEDQSSEKDEVRENPRPETTADTLQSRLPQLQR